MRLHYRPKGYVDWPASLGCLAVAGAILYASNFAARELPLARSKIALGATAITLAIGAGSVQTRATLVRGILGCFSPLSPIRSTTGTITHSEAERDRIQRGPEDQFTEVELSVRARYVVDVELEDGHTRTCVLCKRDWARLRVGTSVHLAWQGIWLRSISADPAPGSGESL